MKTQHDSLDNYFGAIMSALDDATAQGLHAHKLMDATNVLMTQYVEDSLYSDTTLQDITSIPLNVTDCDIFISWLRGSMPD